MGQAQEHVAGACGPGSARRLQHRLQLVVVDPRDRRGEQHADRDAGIVQSSHRPEPGMRRRVELDVYYIQNWSLSFDLYIIALTLLSPKAYRNAH